MKSSIILSCLYDDWASAEVLFRDIGVELQKRKWNFRLLIVDDGSLQARPPDFLKDLVGFSVIEVIRLRRNVGHQRAIAIGLSHIFETNDAEDVVIMDSDGQDRMEDVIHLAEARAAGQPAKIIFAERTRRSESVLFQFFYRVYCAFHVLLTGHGIRFGNFSIVPRSLLGRLVVDPNLWVHFAATVVSSRIPYGTIPTRRGVRLYGESKHNFTALIIHGLAAISCYNEIVGVRLFFFSLGLSLVLFAGILTVFIVRMTTPWSIPGWATFTIGILSVLFVQISMMVLAIVAVAISSRKAHFFLPVQQYKFLIDEIELIH